MFDLVLYFYKIRSRENRDTRRLYPKKCKFLYTWTKKSICRKAYMKEQSLLKILMVDNNPAEIELAIQELKNFGIALQYRTVHSKGSFIAALDDFDPDIIIADFAGIEFAGREALRLALDRDPLRPFLILTGSASENAAIDGLKAGANDYLLKEHIMRLPFAVTKALHCRELRYERDTAVMLEELGRAVLEELTSPVASNEIIRHILVVINERLHFDSVIIHFDSTIVAQVEDQCVGNYVPFDQDAPFSIPLRSGEKNIGVFQIKDRRPDRITPQIVQFFEDLGACIGITVVRKDMEQKLEAERSYLKMLIDNIPDSFYIKDKQGRKVLNNQADMEFIGLKDPKDVIGRTDAEVFQPKIAHKFNTDDEKVLMKGASLINIEEMVESRQGNKRWLLTSKLPIKDPSGNVTGLIGIGRDITERKLQEGKLLNMVHYDMLTGLPNRSLFLERVNVGIAQAKRSDAACAILFIDLDHFKDINDTLGHFIGDALLKDTAQKLTTCVREIDTIARFGGDEFTVFLNRMENVQDARQVAKRIRDELASYRSVLGHDILITASIGIAVYLLDGDDVGMLLKHADMAMYEAKRCGRNGFCFFNDKMNQQVMRKMHIEKALREAVSNAELQLYYQPILGLGDKKIRGFEALLRWFRKDGEPLRPDDFIPIAEETGHIVPIGEWVLREACSFNKRIIDAGFGPQAVSVNVSVTQLKRVNFIQTLKAVLQETGLSPMFLELEVTETFFIDSFDDALETLKSIRDLGVQIALDGFGTGDSSLSRLQKLPISKIKIDREFIKKMLNGHQEMDLTSAIIDLAHKLRLRVTAGGVESELQLRQLRSDGCDFIQGFLFSRPLPEDQLVKFMSSGR